MLSKDNKGMEAPTFPAITQYVRCCASNRVAVRAPASFEGVHVQLRGMQEAVQRQDLIPRVRVQRMHEERVPDRK